MARAEAARGADTSSASAPDERVEAELCHPRGQLKACLLVLLNRRAAHGYELFQQMKPLGYEHDDPARIYRGLHWLERNGLAEPHWDMSGNGPARRVFDITPAGRAMVSTCASSLRKQMTAFHPYLELDRADQNAPDGEPRGSFEVLVEAKLLVQAHDQRSAGPAVEQALGKGRRIAPNVRSTGHVWVYEARQL